MSNIKLYEHFYQGQEGDPLEDDDDDDVDDDDDDDGDDDDLEGDSLGILEIAVWPPDLVQPF